MFNQCSFLSKAQNYLPLVFLFDFTFKPGIVNNSAFTIEYSCELNIRLTCARTPLLKLFDMSVHAKQIELKSFGKFLV